VNKEGLTRKTLELESKTQSIINLENEVENKLRAQQSAEIELQQRASQIDKAEKDLSERENQYKLDMENLKNKKKIVIVIKV
jgi:uncharacterized protein YqfA (UPF0365 family)